MASNDYHFITHWRLPGTVDEVMQVLNDPRDLPRWWPSVYLEVQELEPGDAQGVGRVIDLYTKGWLPYTLRWRFHITEVRQGKGFTLEAAGDFVGRGIWTFTQSNAEVLIDYDWKIRAEKRLLRYFSFLLKPIFAANHRWAMARGEESLRLELARLHATTEEARARIPAPPPPTTSSPLPLLFETVGVLALVIVGITLLARAFLRN